tara:strand:+ start:724 stop:1164 length:441 start_codon:yes stop_codon:yes gene_type:complete
MGNYEMKNENGNILIIDANYYKDISNNLMLGITNVLDNSDFSYIYQSVSGALEIPVAMNLLLSRSEFIGAIGVGCVVRGETSHYDIVANLSAKGLLDVSIKYDIPVTNAIITVNSFTQAIERAKPDIKNRGGHSADALLDLIKLKK